MKTASTILAFAISYCSALAQVDGLWVVSKVEVSGQEKTPVAKWFRFFNGQLVSGNGWQQHTFGSYKLNGTELSLQSDNEPSDCYGSFMVTRDGRKMTWNRNEDGDEVKVYLETAETLPESTADKVKGLWDLFEARRSGAEITNQMDPDGNYYIFIRWDRVFVRQLRTKERVQGYWFMNGHRPELKFISGDNNEIRETWTVSFENETLMLTGLSENVKDLVMRFSRKATF